MYIKFFYNINEIINVKEREEIKKIIRFKLEK